MDFEDIGSELSSGILSVAHSKRESEFVQNSRHCERKSPRKKPKMTRASALMIDQLKNGFPNPAFRDGYNAPRTRTRRNWRPEFLMRYLVRDGDRRSCNEEYTTLQYGRSCSANLVAEAPRIYSIGLRSGARSATNVVDDSCASPLAAMRDCKKRSGIVRRAMIVCKYWIAQTTTATSTVMSANHRTTMFDRTESTVLRKLDRKTNHSRDDRSCERAQERQRRRNNDPAAASRDDRTISDRFCTFDFVDLPAKQYREQIASEFGVTKKDAQIQTSSRKSSRRGKRRKSRSKTTSESIVGRPIGRDSNGTNRSDGSRPFVRALESKRAEYVKKFTAVNRRIEEITAALRETCYGDGSPRSNVEHRERRFLSSTTTRDDDAKAMDVTRESDDDVDDDVNHVVRKRNGVSANVKRIIVGESENDRLRKGVRKILRFSSRFDNDTASSLGKEEYPEGVTVPSTKADGRLNANDIYVRDSVRAYAIKGTFRPSEQTAGRGKGTKYREILKQISVDLDLVARRDDEIQEFSIDNEFLDEARSRDNFPNGDERARVSIEDHVDSERSRSRNEVVVSKVGELTVLEDIKRRIDEDFDGPSTRSEDDAEDFLAVSREDLNFENDGRPVATFEESASASLIVHGSSYSDTSEMRDSMSTDAVSERSNRTSTLSKYHSCTQFPSLISLREDENELAHEVEDQKSTIVRSDSCSELRTSTDYQDLNTSSYVERSHLDVSSSRDRSRLNFGSRFDQSLISVGYVARHPWPTKFFTGMTNNERNDMSPNIIGEEENRIGERECSLGESDRKMRDARVNFEKRYAADCTLEASKSSRYVGSIDSGVFFSSSLIDPHEASFDGEAIVKKPSARRKKQRRTRKCDESPTFDFSSDSNCNDDAHDRRVDDVVRDLTKNLILCEKRARTKLKEMRRTLIRARDARYPRHTSSSHTRKFSKNLDVHYGFFDSARWRNEDERIVSVSTPSLLSPSNSEVEESGHESGCQLNGIRPL